MDTHARGPVVRLLTAVLGTALMLTGLVALAATTAPAAHAAPGTISGKVTLAGTSTPLAGITVVAFCNEDGDWYWCEDTITGPGGAYTLDLPHGTYHVGAYSDDNQYAATFFGGTDRADAAPVVPPASDIDLAMPRNASVKGRIGQGLLNNAVPGADVCLYEQVTYDGDSWWECVSWATTAANGTYTLWATPGTYRVGASVLDNHLRETFYANARTVETGTDVVVTSAGRTAINVKLPANPLVTGKVTAQANGAAVAFAEVRAYELVPGGDPAWDWRFATTADATGTYRLYLPEGTYRLEFDNACTAEGTCPAVYRPEFWNDKADVQSANDLVVTSTGRGGINAALARNPRITGTVTEEDGGAPVAGAEVAALQQVTEEWDGESYTYWETVSSATAAANGTYELYAPAGAYRISFDDACAEICADVYQTEYWEESADIATADDVVLAGSGTFGGKNGTLARNGVVAGTVTAEDGGAPIADVEVVAFGEQSVEVDGETHTGWLPVGFATTDADGAYALPAAPGTYRVGFFEGCWDAACRYLPEFYDDAAVLDDATDVAITGPGATADGVDAALAEGSLISGELTDADGDPVADADVTVYADGSGAGDWEPVNGTWSGEDGRYAVLVADGDYRVGFSDVDGAFTDEFYDDARSVDDADTVTVDGAGVPGIDATLGLLVRNLVAPEIDDTEPQVGDTVTVDTGTWDPGTVDVTVRWFRSGSDEPVGTEASLVVPAEALGETLVAEVTAAQDGYADAVEQTAPTEVVTAGALTSTEAPTVSGAIAVGSTVQAIEGTWSATPDAYAYRWFRSGSATPIGTGKELVVPLEALDQTLHVEVSATRAGHTDGVATSAPTEPVVEGGLVNLTRPTVSGDPRVGATLTVDEGTWSPTPDADAYTYRWFQAGLSEPIGIGRTLVVPAGAVGRPIAVQVTATVPGFGTTSANTAATAAVVPGVLTNTAVPGITGSVAVGGTVQATDGTWSTPPTGATFRWFRSGSTDPIGTARQLVVPAAAAGETLRVEVTATRPGYTSGVATSEPSAAVGTGTIAGTAPPTVTGTVQVGRTVSATNGTWSVSPDSFTYRWYRSGSPTPIGSGRDLVVPAAAVGQTLRVEVTAAADGYGPGTASSPLTDPVTPGELLNTAEPTVTGTVQVGRTVSAHVGTWSVTPESYTYRWYRTGSPTPVGTGKDLVVPSSAAGENLTVEVTAKAAGYADGVASSEPSATVEPGALVATAPPVVTGKAQVGKTLTATSGTWSPAPSDLAYQWYADGVALAGQTRNRLSVTPALVRQVLQVRVTATAPGATGVAWSALTPPVALGTFKVTSRPTLGGRAQVGKKVKVVVPAGSAPAGAKVTVQWLLGKKPIAGATTKGLKLTSALYRGRKVQARVTYTLPGYRTVVLATAKVKVR